MQLLYARKPIRGFCEPQFFNSGEASRGPDS